MAPAVISEVLRPGHDILIDDGHVRLLVQEVEHGRARCLVIVGGEVKSHKGVNLPGVPVPIPSLTKKDLDDLDFALALGVDFVALSFVRAAADVRDLQAIIRQFGSPARVIAKIEKAEAVEALEEVLEESDAIMVARGDLGVEIGAATVPLLQKKIILRLPRGREAGDHRDADARVDDRARGADARRGERRRERDPRRHVGGHALRRDGDGQLSDRGSPDDGPDRSGRRAVDGLPPPGAGGRRADDRRPRDVERRLRSRGDDRRASAILVPTFTGRTASGVARLRPRRPIVGLSHHQTALQQMALEWGVTPVLMPQTENVEDLWSRSLESALNSGGIDKGDRVVLTAGTAVNLPGSTNVIKVDIA